MRKQSNLRKVHAVKRNVFIEELLCENQLWLSTVFEDCCQKSLSLGGIPQIKLQERQAISCFHIDLQVKIYGHFCSFYTRQTALERTIVVIYLCCCCAIIARKTNSSDMNNFWSHPVANQFFPFIEDLQTDFVCSSKDINFSKNFVRISSHSRLELLMKHPAEKAVISIVWPWSLSNLLNQFDFHVTWHSRNNQHCELLCARWTRQFFRTLLFNKDELDSLSGHFFSGS